MFEKFTERARRVMSFARQECQRLNGEGIGTEHILLGIVKDGGGVAVKVLKRGGVEPSHVKIELEKLLMPLPPPPAMLGQLPFTPRAKNVIQFAEEEAYRMSTGVLGTEHLLLGILREGEGIASQVLENLGFKTDRTREMTLEILGAEEEEKPMQDSTHMKVKFYERAEKATEKGAFLVLKGEPYRLTGTVTLTGIAPEKRLEIAASIAEKHRAAIWTVEVD